jgi:signal peptidase II
MPLLPSAEPTSPAETAAQAAEPRAGARLVWWIPILVVAVDQATKAMILAWLPVYDSVRLVPGLASLTHVRNPGVAFGLLGGNGLPYQPALTTALAVLALTGIAYYARHLRPDETFARVGLSLILGGAIGNLADRLRAGYVIDFVDLYWRGWHFWAFNVADACITAGAVLVFLDLLLVKRHASDPL